MKDPNSFSPRIGSCRSLLWGVGLYVLACVALVAEPIDLIGGTVDPEDSPQLSLEMLKGVEKDAEVLGVVQFEGPIQPEWIESLAASGAVIEHYVPHNSYLVTFQAGQLNQVSQVRGMRWMGRVTPELKVHPRLTELAPDEPALMSVYCLDDSIGAVLKENGIAPFQFYEAPMGYYIARIEAVPEVVEKIAEHELVFGVAPYVKPELFGERGAQTTAGNLNAEGSAAVGPGYAAWLAENGLEGGPGLGVHVVDSGLDLGNSSNLPGTAHPDYLGRISGIFNATSDIGGFDLDGHGTINAGIIVGDATVGTTDGGFLLGQGMAPKATVFASKVFTAPTPQGAGGDFEIGTQTLTTLATRAYNAGATFSNNSWGITNPFFFGEYLDTDAEFDALVRDADPNTAGDQPMSHFVSAGNAGPGLGTVGSPATAKNVVSVGASENNDGQAVFSNDARDMAFFSSRGPTVDGRLGVTVVAPGTHVSGTASIHPNFNGLGVTDQFYPAGQTDYARSDGTSHSGPLATGAGMIATEFFEKRFGVTPSPALVKAVLTNTATDIFSGARGDGVQTGHIPNEHQGWGRVNLDNLVNEENTLFWVDQDEVFTASGNSVEYELFASASDRPLKVTLTWTDVPAFLFANPSIVNDLDLEVIDQQTSQIYRGNNFANGVSVSGGSFDRIETLESVYIPNPSGLYTIRVTAHNIVGDALPNSSGLLQQDFALFATNVLNPSGAGKVTLDQAVVNCTDTLEITVEDFDLRDQADTTVVVESTSGDTLVPVLGQISPSNLFQGEITIEAGEPASDNILQVADGDTITVTYTDADNGMGGINVPVVETVAVDCTAPVISNVNVVRITNRTVTVEFTTDEPARGQIFFGSSCGTLTQSTELEGGLTTSHQVILRGLSAATTYFFRVESTDQAGNTGVNTNNAQCFEVTTAESAEAATEQFDGLTSTPDLEGLQITFTPDPFEASGYVICQQPTNLEIEHDDGIHLEHLLAGGDSIQIGLPTGRFVRIQDQLFDTVWVNAAGFVSFEAPGEVTSFTLEDHFSNPKISGLFAALDVRFNGSVLWRAKPDRIQISWLGVPDLERALNTFQIEILDTGVINLKYQKIESTAAIVGLSNGEGVPTNFASSDLSGSPTCAIEPNQAGNATDGSWVEYP